MDLAADTAGGKVAMMSRHQVQWCYDASMRTTLTVDDELLGRVKHEARRARVPFRTALERALRLGLERMRPQARRRMFKQRTFRMGHPPASRLDKALQLSAMLEDEEIVRKATLSR